MKPHDNFVRLRLVLPLFLSAFLLFITTVQSGYGAFENEYKPVNSLNGCNNALCYDSVNDDSKQGQKNVKTSLLYHDKLSLKAEKRIIGSYSFLWFEGDGWHRHHYVRIKISSDDFSTMIKGKTSWKGHLSVPWQIPDSLKPGTYGVSATDGTNSVETKVTIDSGRIRK